MVFLKNALMCVKKVKLINHDCLPILMLYKMLAYFVLSATLSIAVCLYNASSFSNDFCKCFCFHALSWFIFMLCLGLLTHSLFISCINLYHAQCF